MRKDGSRMSLGGWRGQAPATGRRPGRRLPLGPNRGRILCQVLRFTKSATSLFTQDLVLSERFRRVASREYATAIASRSAKIADVATRRRAASTRKKPDTSRRPSPNVPALWLAVLVLATGAWAYSTSFRGVFVLDDVRAIARNSTIRTLWPLTTPLAPPTGSTVAGRPIANLSFAINHALAPATPAASAGGGEVPGGAGPLDPAPYHAGNLVIHLAASLVLFGLVRRTLQSRRLQVGFGAAASWLALVVALVWVVHPIQTGAVTYVVQRVESLMGLFYLLTLYCAIRASAGSRPRLWTAAAIASCACGMATKEVMVTAPIVVAIWGRLFMTRPSGNRRGAGLPVAFGRQPRTSSRIVDEVAPKGLPAEIDGPGRMRWGMTAGLASTWIVLAVLVAGERRGPSVSIAWDAVWPYLLAQAEVVVHYLRLAILPAPLVFFYDWPLGSSLGAVAWQAGVLTALVIVTIVGIVRRHPASFLGAWFFLILAPSSSVLPIVTEVAAEHRMYLPLAAIVAAAVLGLFVLGRRMAPSPKAAAVAGALAAMAAVGALGIETRERNRVYWSAESLWQDTVSKRPNDARARVAYGDALAGAGRLAEAEAQLQAGVALGPGDPAAHVRLGAVLAQQRKFDAAVLSFERALALRPGYVDAHRLLGEIYGVRRQDALAARNYEQALVSLPDDAKLIARLAAILADSRDVSVRNPSRARELADRAVRLTSGRDPRMLEILSVAQAASGRLAEAAATARVAAEVARGLGDRTLVSALEYRARAYESAARK